MLHLWICTKHEDSAEVKPPQNLHLNQTFRVFIACYGVMEIWYTLTGEVDKKSVQDSISWINSELYSKPITHLRLLLASNGGEIGAGINLHTYLKALPIEVQTISFGALDVAAVLIFLGGVKRSIVEGCQFFFHEGRYTVNDPTAPVHAHEEAISVFKRELHEMIYIIARETNTDTELVANMLRKSKIMKSDEALDFGLAHEILEKLPLQQQDKGFGFIERPRMSQASNTKKESSPAPSADEQSSGSV
jgi:ATP-dependent protease ClpP protease subunit